MKRAIILIFMVCTAMTVRGREVVDINRGWRFFMNSEGSGDRGYDVNLPHTWNNDALSGKRDYSRGIGNYVRNTNIPISWKGKRVFIKLYGTSAITTVLVNGRTAGEHKGGYTAFAFEITDMVVPGKENTIWLMVNNSPQTNVLPTAGDMNAYGGCFRDVELIVTEPVALSPTDYGSKGVYIHPRKVTNSEVEGEVELKISSLTDKSVQSRVIILTAKGDTVATENGRIKVSGKQTASLSIPFSVKNPTLWNGTENPHMYSVSVSLLVDGKLCDSLVVRTGFRHYTITADEGFKLNGKPFQIKGVCVTQDRAMSGPALTRYQVEEDVRLVREMGANAVRVMGAPHNPYFYELCDILGILVWSDLPWMGNTYLTDRQFVNTDGFMASGREQLREIVRQQYNHPSIVVWGLFSDLGLRGDNTIAYIRELDKIAKAEDPHRLTGATSSEDGDMNFVSDVVMWNHSMGWKEGYPSDIKLWLTQLRDNWGKLRSAITYGAGGSIYHQDDNLTKPAYLGNWHPERWQTHLHQEYYANISNSKILWGIFIGNLFDYGAAGREWGEGNGINDMGLVTFDRKYRKDAFYLYKVNWNDDPMVYIAEKRWQKRHSRKQEFRVYSNAGQVELFVNDVSQGTRQRDKIGLFIWSGIELERGTNSIKAQSEDSSDTALIYIEGK